VRGTGPASRREVDEARWEDTSGDTSKAAGEHICFGDARRSESVGGQGTYMSGIPWVPQTRTAHPRQRYDSRKAPVDLLLTLRAPGRTELELVTNVWAGI
jgi:hypothetical protein